ncbi:hypothetical protein MMC25_006372 [Agyrium rufum]|nr:hypothetical protein [Agyrium rufum]
MSPLRSSLLRLLGASFTLLALVTAQSSTTDVSSATLRPSTTTASSTSTAPAPASTTSSIATIVPGSATYSYLGCYNETTELAQAGDVRALNGGNMTASDTMTVAQCLAFCGQVGLTYAGLEYARECWCAATLNTNAAKLPDANCTDPCAGDDTEICGGSLKLSVYQQNSSASSSGSGSGSGSSNGKSDASRPFDSAIGASGLGVVVLLAFLVI